MLSLCPSGQQLIQQAQLQAHPTRHRCLTHQLHERRLDLRLQLIPHLWLQNWALPTLLLLLPLLLHLLL